MRLRALREEPWPGLRLLSGDAASLERPVRGVMTTDLRDPSRYLNGGELVLTGLAWWRGPADSEPFVRILAAAGAAGLAAGEAEFGPAPDDLAAACRRHGLPLFAVPEEVGFADLTEYVVRRVSATRAGDLAAVVDRHRRLMSPAPGGGGPQAVLDLLASDLDLRAWLLSPTGRVIASGGGPADERTAGGAAEEGNAGGGAPFPAWWPGAASVVRARGGRPGPYRAVVEGVVHSVFPVASPMAAPARLTDLPHLPDLPDLPDLPERAEPATLSDWLLIVRADARDWPGERLGLLEGVVRLIEAERDRREAARGVPRRLAQEVLTLLRAGAPAPEVAARLLVAGPVLVPGAGRAAAGWQVVTARLEPAPEGGSLPPAARTGGLARSLLEELLPAPPGSPPEAGAAVAHEDGEAVALLPLGAAAPDGEEALSAARLLAPAREALAEALAAAPGGSWRLTLGVSAGVPGAEALRGALEEARHARRVAAAGPGAVAGAGHEELASHVLLLPFVPDDVRRAFASRLLEPLRAYDRRHRADLVGTLRAFLACDGSWTRCAARLHVHVNTLRYRVGRIEQLTGRDLTRLEDTVDFFLALRMDLPAGD
ncbi:PucR family transcriptional regulator ligand-binding domain-containing protein [Streptomyces sp. DSM 44917]|uniref:PucR family transcriptional regulator ligand-binding domain-containing protein n=1 Tax=Streptomyces boetiae TaxID=3075541 RepID=A0ABU2L2F9_9ACTN|nr:PucR family transcriptional regulator ligand-binding domain-containing protein [Streptomyces sp. DSM 44917]MDT0305751.1 PucR family transcriptional regulator ligand-binding domain-containing protein [Streptomyces sp. DSM 44917]